MAHTIHWQLPGGAFHGMEQGRPLDTVLDAYLDGGEDPSALWHVTGPQTHYLFRDEAQASACAAAKNDADRAYAEEFPEAWGVQGAGTSYCAWCQTGDYGRAWEARRQARLRAGFERACAAAQARFTPGVARCYDLTHWSDLLNAPARSYGTRHGLVVGEGA